MSQMPQQSRSTGTSRIARGAVTERKTAMGPFRRVALKSAVVVALSIAALASSIGTASASTNHFWGYPGSVGVPRIVGTTLNSNSGSIVFGSRYVTKSPQYAAYSQQVCVSYNIVWATATSTQWSNASSSRACSWLTTNSSTGFAAFGVPGLAKSFAWAANVRVDWYLSNGAWIGTTIVDENAVSDYICNSCQIRYSTALGAYIWF
jgi:hypothetical protein